MLVTDKYYIWDWVNNDRYAKMRVSVQLVGCPGHYLFVLAWRLDLLGLSFVEVRHCIYFDVGKRVFCSFGELRFALEMLFSL